MQLLRLYYLLQVQVDGIQVARTSLIPAVLGSLAAATIAMVLLQACSSSTVAVATAAVTARLTPLWFRFLPRLSENGSSRSNTPKTKIVDMIESI